MLLLGIQEAASAQGFERLEQALERYRGIASDVSEPPPPPIPPGPALKPGAKGKRVAALRARLAMAAEAEGAYLLPETDHPEVFDYDLEQAVRDYQDRHGLTSDGIAGASTLAEVNKTAEEQLRKIEVNLERWRRLPADLGQRYILVNIAGFRLDAIEDGRSVLDMRVIVGRTHTRTPVVSSAIETVVLNPSWYVPKSIASKELWPKGESYLRDNGFQVLPDGKLRQKPGANNSLGQVKFQFPNRFGVYLHDTPTQSLFDRTVRAFSHGCVRVERPEDLAAWVLEAHPEWSPEAIWDTIDSGRERAVRLPEPIPVHIVYWTAWVDEYGTLRFGPDVYDEDDKITYGSQLAAGSG
ncbi:MAG TPA: L,D-transpeptidase family protein [Thermoanaerobaculia bacterium]|nr:L,D-transpeptidase family protein [Thermoanaerobaculia bacterium]